MAIATKTGSYQGVVNPGSPQSGSFAGDEMPAGARNISAELVVGCGFMMQGEGVAQLDTDVMVGESSAGQVSVTELTPDYTNSGPISIASADDFNNATWLTACPGGADGRPYDPSFSLVGTYDPNNVPVASDDEYDTPYATEVSGQLSATDGDSDPLTYAEGTTAPTKGVVDIDPDTGEFTYTPNQGEVGEDTFTFIANDGYEDSNEATITINIGNPKSGQSSII